MRIKDTKSKLAYTVGDVKAFLAQFPDDMPIRAHAEPDACCEFGFPFISLRADPFTSETDGNDPIPEGNEDEWEVKTVLFEVDH